MEPFKKVYVFKIERNTNTKEKIKNYFKSYNFLSEENEVEKLVFFKKFSYLQAWRINPLNWESKIVVSIKENEVTFNYVNEGNAHITPYAFEDLFNSFFNNLELHLNKSVSYTLKNETEIKSAKQKVLLQFLIIIEGIFAFVAIGRFIKEEFNLGFLNRFSIIIGGLLSLKMLNRYWVQKVS